MSLYNDKNLVHSVRNAMRILRLFTPKHDEWGITQMAAQLNLPKSTVHRYVRELVREGFLTQNRGNGNYQLGWTILTLGGIAQTYQEIYLDAVPHLQKLALQFRLPAHICIMENRYVYYLIREMGNSSIKLITKSGRYNDLHCTAEGLAILAFKGKDVIRNALRGPLTRYTEFTITDPDLLEQQLMQIRSDQFAVTKDTYARGYTSMAVPIRDFSGEVAASLALIGETKQFSQFQTSEIVRAMQKSAEDISKLLGYYEG